VNEKERLACRLHVPPVVQQRFWPVASQPAAAAASPSRPLHAVEAASAAIKAVGRYGGNYQRAQHAHG